jgi:hypothetical protein
LKPILFASLFGAPLVLLDGLGTVGFGFSELEGGFVGVSTGLVVPVVPFSLEDGFVGVSTGLVVPVVPFSLEDGFEGVSTGLVVPVVPFSLEDGFVGFSTGLGVPVVPFSSEDGFVGFSTGLGVGLEGVSGGFDSFFSPSALGSEKTRTIQRQTVENRFSIVIVFYVLFNLSIAWHGLVVRVTSV